MEDCLILLQTHHTTSILDVKDGIIVGMNPETDELKWIVGKKADGVRKYVDSNNLLKIWVECHCYCGALSFTSILLKIINTNHALDKIKDGGDHKFNPLGSTSKSKNSPHNKTNKKVK